MIGAYVPPNLRPDVEMHENTCYGKDENEYTFGAHFIFGCEIKVIASSPEEACAKAVKKASGMPACGMLDMLQDIPDIELYDSNSNLVWETY